MAIKGTVLSSFQKLAWFFIGSNMAEKFYTWMLLNQVKSEKLPQHIGVILDGNRRWANKMGLTAKYGHLEGAKKAEAFLTWCMDLEAVKTVTFYVFSTENFTRRDEEVEEILDLVRHYLESLLTDGRIHSNQIRVKVLGRLTLLPEKIQDQVRRLENATESYDRYYLNLAIAYGGRAEIVDAVRRIAVDILDGHLSPKDVEEKTIEERLYTHFLPNPNPDLIIRTSGEERLSNFLLWQSAYSELCFLDVYWPGFRKIDLLRAVRLYQQCQRRFGS